MAKIKRSQIQSFLDVNPSGAASLKLLGSGVVSGKITYNPKTSEETYVHQDTASIAVESYAPTLAVEMTAQDDDDVFGFLDTLRRNRSTLSDAETDLVNVWMYEAGGPTAYPAERQPVSIQIDDFGGDGGTAAKINFTINFVGPATAGTFNANTNTFTAS